VVGDRTLHRLPDPPRRVRGETPCLVRVDLLDRSHEPEYALLEEVLSGETLHAVRGTDAEDQSEVVEQQLLLCEYAMIDSGSKLLTLGVAALSSVQQFDCVLAGRHRARELHDLLVGQDVVCRSPEELPEPVIQRPSLRQVLPPPVVRPLCDKGRVANAPGNLK
jgi:hypothetical protein